MALAQLTAAQLNAHLRDNLLETAVAKVTTKGDMAIATAANALARLGVGANNSILVADSAATTGVKWQAAMVGARVKNSGTQSCSDGADKKLSWDGEDFDTDTIHDTSTNPERLTATTAGTYIIIANVQFTSNATGERVAYIKFGGSTEIARTSVEACAGSYTTDVPAHAVYQFAAGEYVELFAKQNSGGPLTVTTACRFSMWRIGP